MRIIGPKLPLRHSTEHGFYAGNVSYMEEIKQNLKNIVLTNPGERIGYPDFGVGLRHLLFEPNTDNTLSTIKERIFSQVGEYLPLVEIEGVELYRKGSEQFPTFEVAENEVRVRIKYYVPELLEEDMLELFF